MTELRDLLAECHARAIRLQQDGHGGLTIDGSGESLTSDLIDRLKAQKGDILAVLAVCTARTDPPDPAAVWRVACLLLEGDTLFPAGVLEGLRSARAEWATEEPVPAATD